MWWQFFAVLEPTVFCAGPATFNEKGFSCVRTDEGRFAPSQAALVERNNTMKRACVFALLLSCALEMNVSAQLLQQGTKLVGTDAVGTAGQGFSVSLSSDGNTAIVGGFTDNSNTGAAWMYIDAQPGIAAVKDIPFDQGGTAVILWNKSRGDDPPSSLVTEYWVWRGIRASSAPGGALAFDRKDYISKAAKNEANPLTFMRRVKQDNNGQLAGDIYWQYITSLPSHALAHYSYACPTLADSTVSCVPFVGTPASEEACESLLSSFKATVRDTLVDSAGCFLAVFLHHGSHE